jgi:hypothetical protein
MKFYFRDITLDESGDLVVGDFVSYATQRAALRNRLETAGFEQCGVQPTR